MNKVLCCVDSKNFAEAVCDYGILISNATKSPLHFLHIVEHDHSAKKLNLSGNLSLGEKDTILEELTQNEADESKANIQNGKILLGTLKDRASQQSKQEVITSQIHGDFIENIVELKDDISILVIAVSSSKEKRLGDNVKEAIREVRKPVLLVNDEFTKPKKILIAYNGSKESTQALRVIAESPFFGKVERTIICVNDSIGQANKLLNEAKMIFAREDIPVATKAICGEVHESIINYFDNNDFDILVMGAFGHSRFKGFIFGSITEKIISRIKKPILLLR
jgi:nucleotide-binding universal stress UspA family protein